MSMFPGSHATVYRNELGEPLGWSDESHNDPPVCGICGGEGHSEDECYDEEEDSDDSV